MKLEMFINFNGNCREAVEFYAKVFRAEKGHLLTYGEAPQDSEHPVKECDRERILYAGLPVGGMVLMFMDMPSGFPVVSGNNINPTLSMDDKQEVSRIFSELCEGGEVISDLQKTFYSELYGMVKDKFGVIWHIMQFEQQAQ